MPVWKRKIIKKAKPWGHEDRYGSMFNVGAKVIHIKEGHRTSLKKMTTKNQIYICVSGLVKAYCPEETELTENFEIVIKPGDQICVTKGTAYRLEGLKDSILVEISDSGVPQVLQGIEMLDDDYGRKGVHPKIVNFKV